MGGAKVLYNEGIQSPLPCQFGKRVLYEYLGSTIQDFLSYEPATIGTASNKFENGKARAIYGTGVVDYTVYSFVLSNLESRMDRVEWVEEGESGFEVMQSMQKRLQAVQTAGVRCSMGDYKDFNLQHSMASQAAIYEVLLDIITAANCTSESYIRAVAWCADAAKNQVVYVPNKNMFDRSYTVLKVSSDWKVVAPSAEKAAAVVQGMFSGYRGTGFTNTVLNLAYVNAASRYVHDRYKQNAIGVLRAHKGDDIWITNENIIWAALLYNTMSEQGLEFQPAKQLFGEKGEYLRVRYSPEGTRGYLCRAISSWAVSPLQGTATVDFVSRCEEAQRSAATLYRRGGRAGYIAALLSTIMHSCLSVKLRTSEKDFERFHLPAWPLEASYALGGIDYGMPNTRANTGMKLPSLPRLKYTASDLVKHIPQNMSESQVERDWLPMGLDARTATAIKKIYHEQNISVVSDPRMRVRDELKYTSEIKTWLKSINRRKGMRAKCRRMDAASIEHCDFISKIRCEERDCSYDAAFEVFIPKGGLDV